MNSAENRMKISKQNIGFTKEANSFSKSWEKISGPSLYNDLRQETVEDRLLAQDFSAIKRSGSFYDDGESARTTTSGLKAFSSDEYMNAMLSRSASIFNPDNLSKIGRIKLRVVPGAIVDSTITIFDLDRFLPINSAAAST